MEKETPPSEAMGLVNLASPRMGTEIHSVSDDFFAEAVDSSGNDPAGGTRAIESQSLGRIGKK